ncbi:MAG: T9SS type A sorting domain-containing protein [Bacteroidia bacterium]|nr:T9SS type A sorting domain-containing protein [Bacteroidia bacterium]
MKKSILLSLVLTFVITISKAQTTAMNFNKKDCSGTMHNLFTDLDAGNAVILHFFMPNCGSCPPPAQKIQAMANNILKSHPGKIKAYAIPFNNSTTCSYASTWVSSNGLSLYTALDSGSAQVAHYGGFGMPTVVVLGGIDHKVLFSTLSFSTSDTTTMRNSILNMLNGTAGIDTKIINDIPAISVFPNPAIDNMQIELNLSQTSNIKIEVINMLGEIVSAVYNGKAGEGVLRKEVSTTDFSNGIYFVRVISNNNLQNYKFTVTH